MCPHLQRCQRKIRQTRWDQKRRQRTRTKGARVQRVLMAAAAWTVNGRRHRDQREKYTQNGRFIRSQNWLKNITNDKGCRIKMDAWAQKLGTEPDECVKECVRHCMSLLLAEKGSAPKSNLGAPNNKHGHIWLKVGGNTQMAQRSAGAWQEHG